MSFSLALNCLCQHITQKLKNNNLMDIITCKMKPQPMFLSIVFCSECAFLKEYTVYSFII